MKKLILISFFTFFWVYLSAQTNFSRGFRPNEDLDGSLALNIQHYEDGYLLLIGRIDINNNEYTTLVKINQMGDMEWSRKYFLDNQPSPPDAGITMVLDSTHIFIGCNTEGDAGKLDWQILCIERQSLEVAWTKRFSDPSNEVLIQILGTKDNALILTGTSQKPQGGDMIRLIKIDKLGNLLWNITNEDFAKHIVWQATTALDGNILVSYSAGEYGSFFYGGALSKFSLDGDLLWTKKFEITKSLTKTSCVTQLNNGDIAFGWVKDTFAIGGMVNAYPPTVYILDSLGNTKRVHSYHNRFGKDFLRAQTLFNGDLIFAGTASNPTSSFDEGAWLACMKPNGDTVWNRSLTDLRYKYGLLIDAISTLDGGILAVGTIESIDSIPSALVWIVKLDGNGCYESDCSTQELIITSAGEIAAPPHKYQLQPNPAIDKIKIQGWTGSKEKQAEIIALNGSVIRLGVVNEGVLGISDLPKGWYTLKITFQNNTFTTLKFIKS
jgi:hypothetical protein